MKKGFITEATVIKMVRAYIEDELEMTYTAYAEATGIKRQYLTRQLNGERPFGDELYEAIGVDRKVIPAFVTTYKKVSK